MARSRPAPRPRLSWPVALGAVFGLAFLWRLAYLDRLGTTPLAGGMTEDARIYWDWAGFLLRSGPWGKNPFFLGPLYPYILWPLRAVFGDSLQPVLFIQALWGAAAATLLADAARRLTRPSIGITVGVLVALYETAVFFDGLVLMESLLFFLEALLLWLVVRGEWPQRLAAPYALIGLVIGLLAEGRATSLLLLLPAWLALVYRRGVRASDLLRPSLALITGAAVVVIPFAVRNVVVSRAWIPFTYNAGYNVYVGNHADASGAYVDVIGAHESVLTGEDGGGEGDGRAYLRATKRLDLSPAASSSYWAREALAYALRHPVHTAALAARKAVMMWNHREYAQIENVREYRDVAGPLGLPIVGSFAVLGPLALAGLVVARRRGAHGTFLIGYVLVMTLAIVPFFVTDRYRHHLVPAAALLAGLTLAHGLDALRGRGDRGGAWLAAALAAGIVITRLPTPALSDEKYAWGLAIDLGTRWSEHGRPDLAAREYEKAIEMEQRGTVTLPRNTSTNHERADLYYNYANALGRLGREPDAVVWLERAVALVPDHPFATRALADAYRRTGDPRADALGRALGSAAPGSGTLDQAWAAARANRWSEAESLFTLTTREHPEASAAWGALIRIQAQLGRPDDARATLDRAVAAGMSTAETDLYRALLAAMAGDRSAARALLARVPGRLLESDGTLADVAQVVRRLIDAP